MENYENQSAEKNFGKKLQQTGTDLVKKAKALPKKAIIAIAAGVAALALAIVLILVLTNNYKTPVTLAQKALNNKKYATSYEKLKSQLNGFASAEMNTIIKIYKKSEDYKDNLDERKENYQESIDKMKEEYGSNYKYTIKVTEKEKLDKDDLKYYKEEIKESADKIYDSLKDLIDETSPEEWEDLAEEMGLTKAQVKDMANAALKIAKKVKSAKITAGYELDVTIKLDGSEMDEPDETETTYVVVKVDGRWVSLSALSSLLSMAWDVF